jgi:mono/diheme cytochrome c family protein
MRVRAWIFVFALAGALGAAVLPLQAQQDPAALPPGPGREAVAGICSQCHSIRAVTQLREGATAWRHQIYDMIGRGAQVRPDEIEAMVTYLTANFGPGIPFPGQTPSQVQLAHAPGSDLVTAKCSLCHGVDRVIAAKRSRGQWDTIVKKMTYLGAPVTADQAKTIVTYLSTAYGR